MRYEPQRLLAVNTLGFALLTASLLKLFNDRRNREAQSLRGGLGNQLIFSSFMRACFPARSARLVSSFCTML